MSSARWALGATSDRRVSVGGVRIAYDDDGAGPPVVCLHAIGHGAGDFAALRARFAPAHRVVAIDWPGHGRSDDDATPASSARYAELLAEALRALDVAPAVLVGNSVGGNAAIRVAAAHPDRVRGVVLEDPGGLDRGGLLARLLPQAMARFFRAGARRAPWFPWAFARYYDTVLPRAPEARARIVAAAFDSAPVLAQAWSTFGTSADDAREAAASLRCPVLFAWAKSDRVIQLGRNRAAIAQVPRAELALFPGGHSPHLEAPAAFMDALGAFLTRTDHVRAAA